MTTALAPSAAAFSNTRADSALPVGGIAFVDVADVEHRLGGQQLRALERLCFLGILRLGQPRRLDCAQQLERLAEHRGLDLRFLVALLRLLDEVGDAPLEAVEVGQHQLGLDRLGVGDRIDPALDMGDVAALEAAQHMDDRIHLADVGEELVAEPFALACAAHQAGDVDELDLGLDLLADLAISAILSSRGSGTATRPTLGSIVQKG